MLNWKISLDRYLTTPPEDNYYTSWVEQVYESFDDDFYQRLYEDNRNFLLSDLEDTWLLKLYNKNYSPKLTSKIIQRTYDVFKKYI